MNDRIEISNGKTDNISVNDLPKGIYTITVSDENITQAQRFLKQ
jgi:hypothetical protein